MRREGRGDKKRGQAIRLLNLFPAFDLSSKETKRGGGITLKDDGGTEKVCQCHGAVRLCAQPAISGRKERKKKKERRQYNQL